MNITLTVRGALEEDAALQEIVSILYRKASEARGEIEAGDGKGNMYVPTPKPGVPTPRPSSSRTSARPRRRP